MSVRVGNKHIFGIRRQPLPETVIKGIKAPARIESTKDLRKLNFILRRRHLGILDEQTLIKKNMRKFDRGGRNGIENYFANEFVARSAAGFQCVARRNVEEDFVVSAYDKKTNSFNYRITLRHIPHFDVHKVIAATHNIQTCGFLNYYYGTDFLNPHVRQGVLPGLSLLLGHYATAFELLCNAPRILKQSIVMEKDNLKNSWDAENAARLIRRHSEEDVEKQSALARELQKHRPVELTDALCKHTFETVFGVGGCTKFVGEFAAVVWNECLSRRVRQVGARTIVDGDFVVASSDVCSSKLQEIDIIRAFSSHSNSHSEQVRRDIHDVLLPTLGHSTYFSSVPSQSWKIFTAQSLRKYGINSASFFGDFSPASGSVVDHNENEADDEIDDDDVEFDHFRSSRDAENDDDLDLLLCLDDGNGNTSSSPSCQKLFPSLNFQNLPLWTFEGEYRRMIEYPQNFSWKLSPDHELTEKELGYHQDRREANDPWMKDHRTETASCSSSSSSSGCSLLTSSSSSSSSSRDNNDGKGDDDDDDDSSSTKRNNNKMPVVVDSSANKKSTSLSIVNGSVVSTPGKVGLLHKLELSFSLPPYVSPWMMLREMCKMDRHVYDEGLRRSIQNRQENVRQEEAEKAAMRSRIFKRIRRKHMWSNRAGGGHHPEQMDSARLMNSIFFSNGYKSLMPSSRGRDDILQ